MSSPRFRALALGVPAIAVLAAGLWLSAAAGRGAAAAAPGAEEDPATDSRPAVLLELFTSEGCSSCPPADLLLEELAGGDLARGVEVVPLSLHVDYWNHLGWRDPFSDAAHSRRQERYARVLPGAHAYTPMLVIDGAEHLVGSDRRAILAALERARKHPKAVMTLRPEEPEAGAAPEAATAAPGASLRWRIELDAGDVPRRPFAPALFVAVTEDGLASSVPRGENAGRRLTHVAVVRSLDSPGQMRLDADGRAARSVTVEVDPSWRRDQLHLVAWVADGERGPVIGAVRVGL